MSKISPIRVNWYFKVFGLVGLLLAPCLIVAETINGRVVRVSDGDTLAVLAIDLRKVTIRLAGIDAPEKLQDFGPEAKQQLTELCLDKPVQVEVRTTDRYRRTVARVSCDGVDAATKMLQLGLAWHFTRYAHSQPQEEAVTDRREQDTAKLSGLGLWSQPNPISPWTWRAQQREKLTR